MTLSFTLEDGLYVAEFEATSRFNLHLERPASGSIYMKQKTVKDGSYVIVKDFGWNRDGDLIIDADCGQGAVYPKWIRLESAVEPSVAEVTFESESSGGGAGTESTMEYLDVSGMSGAALDLKQFLVPLSYNAKVGVSIIPPLVFVVEGIDLADVVSNATQCAINFDMQMYYSSTFMTIKELLIMRGVTEETLAAIPRITKEEFYSLEA